LDISQGNLPNHNQIVHKQFPSFLSQKNFLKSPSDPSFSHFHFTTSKLPDFFKTFLVLISGEAGPPMTIGDDYRRQRWDATGETKCSRWSDHFYWSEFAPKPQTLVWGWKPALGKQKKILIKRNHGL